MKIKGHITEVSDAGDHLIITGQGIAGGDAAWQPYRGFTIKIPCTAPHKRAYHVGRCVEVTVKTIGKKRSKR